MSFLTHYSTTNQKLFLYTKHELYAKKKTIACQQRSYVGKVISSAFGIISQFTCDRDVFAITRLVTLIIIAFDEKEVSHANLSVVTLCNSTIEYEQKNEMTRQG